MTKAAAKPKNEASMEETLWKATDKPRGFVESATDFIKELQNY